MRSGLALVLLLGVSRAYAGTPCEVSGDARLWAYDACMWRFETDDALHPGVMKCADENQALIARVGSCKAKRIFKDRICTLARTWKLDDPAPKTCMVVDKPLGTAYAMAASSR